MSDNFSRAIEAIKNGDPSGLAEVLSDVPDVGALLTKTISDGCPTNHAIGRDATLLQLASIRLWKDQDMSRQLLDLGASVDLHSATGLGNVERITEILADDPGAIHKQIDTYVPLQFAITANQPDSIQTLMKHGDDPNRDLRKVAYFGWEDDALNLKYTPWKPIHMAALWGFGAKRVPPARALLEAGADIDAASPLDGYRPIHLAAMGGRVDMIRFLAESGADINSPSKACDAIRLGSENAGPCEDGIGLTPLMVGGGEGFLAVVECLLELGADVNAKCESGRTALHFAAKRFWDGQPYDEVIDLLLASGADREQQDNQGSKPQL